MRQVDSIVVLQQLRKGVNTMETSTFQMKASSGLTMRRGLWKRIWANRWGYLFLLPVFAIMGTFKYYPTLEAIVKSFYEWNGYNISKFVGLDNYIHLMHDEVFITSLGNVALIAIASLIKTFTFPLFAAELVFWERSKRFKETSKYLFVIPMVVPIMVVILMWKWIYNPSFGALNQFIGLFGVDIGNHAWLGSKDTALFSLILVGFPWIGGTPFLIILGGLQSISEELFEAAIIDGANAFQRFFTIDLPLISGQLRLLAITTLVQAFSSFENVMVLTNGGPGDYTMVPALHMYEQGMTYYKMGYACTIGMSIFLIVFVFTLISFKIKRKNA
jgi:raffinose/stachyose/melibiose transport system permease protein